MLKTTEVRTTVYHVVTGLMRESNPEAPEPTGGEELNTLGLDSLTLARLIIELEAATGVDPFSEDVVLSDVRCLDDLVDVYERALAARGA
ncbi:phosphopantetheine-binding protein [Streptomyces camelliae]|uniref:Phosphopantetheine-binding protein n=1 Tax=Streptomyces camelliae TaxID=3004093 RepID=A0ABY7P5A6_9ACTN|nr:phosphopantetheine-binding protein [Streptomyces sp. HUAS 2-6]WBO63438.1 phosphopantetheine-binding protein [Streptomyces sp. HUAS 2-6]